MKIRKKSFSVIKSVLALSLVFAAVLGLWGIDVSLKGAAPDAIALGEELVSSRFALDSSKTDYVSAEPGLRNPYVVGIDEDKFINEIKYPTPEGAYEIGIAAPKYEFQDSTGAVQEALNRAREYQSQHEGAEVVLKFPAGNFYFYQGAYDMGKDEGLTEEDDLYNDGVSGKYAVFLSRMKNLTFEGSVDSEGKLTTECLLFGEVGFHFMKISDCENVRLYNLQIDYADLPYYFGEVTEKRDNYTLRIKTWEDYPVDNTNIEVYIEYDKDTNCMREAANNTYNSSAGANILSVTRVNGDRHLIDIRFLNKVSTTPLGTKVALSTMKASGNVVIVETSKNIYFETVYLYCGGGSAIFGKTNENMYFNRLMAVLKPGTDRLLGIAGDVIHLEDTKGEFTLTNSQLENTQDDGINIAGHYMYPYMVDSSKNTAILLYRGAANATYECRPGDVLAMMDTSTMLVKSYYQVKGVEVDSGSRYVVCFEKGGTAMLPSGETVELAADVSGIGNESNSIFSNLTRTPVVYVGNTVIQNKRNRGLLIQSRNVTVENCEFSNVVNTALMLIGEMSSFCESTLPRDVIVRNCKFINCDDNDIQIAAYNNSNDIGAAGAISNVVIENNLFAYQQNRYSLYLAGIGGMEIRDNWFYKPQTATKPVHDTSAIVMRNCAEIDFDGNLLTKYLPARGGIFVWEGVDVGSFEWGENEGFARKEVFGESAAMKIAKADKAITVDGSIADWIGLEATEIPIDNVTNVHLQKLNIADIPESDFSATVKAYVKISGGDAFAADDGIYFYFNVVDDTVAFERSSWWAGDCFEFYMSSDVESHDEIGVIRDEEGTETLQMVIKGDVEGNNSPCIYPGRTTTSVCGQLELSTAAANAEYVGGPIKTGFAMTKNGYRGEAFIPFSLFPVCGTKLKNGEEIAMAFCFVDAAEIDENELLGTAMTFSNVLHPTPMSNKVPATMVKFSCNG